MKSSTINKKEIDKFSKIAEDWWNPEGKFKPLHQFNPERIKYIKDNTIKHFNLTNKDKPFNFIKARLASVNGKVNKNLPPIANNIAKKINPIKNNNLKPFDIFFDEILLIYFNSKYKMTNINTV